MKKIQSKITLSMLLLIALIALILIPLRLESQTTEDNQQAESNTESVQIEIIERDHAVDLERAIVLAEGNGKVVCTVTGLSGEKGCHQFMPSTWRSYSRDVFGYVAPQTPENAEKVTIGKIRGWIAEGYTDTDIFLTWNQGNRSPCKKGVNPRTKVAYNSCEYVAKAQRYLKQVMNN